MKVSVTYQETSATTVDLYVDDAALTEWLGGSDMVANGYAIRRFLEDGPAAMLVVDELDTARRQSGARRNFIDLDIIDVHLKELP
jgi:hypothetical protein